MRKAHTDESEQLSRTTEKLLILGTASTKDEAPIGDRSFQAWAVSPYAEYPGVVMDKIDVIFEMHTDRYWKLPHIEKRLNDFGGPVVMHDHYETIPRSVAYPREAVEKEFYIPAMGKDLYATNTVSYMVAMGYLMGYREFHLYGVHMSHNSEFGYQKPSCEYFLGYLAAKGCTIVLPKKSALLHTPYLYGYNEPWEDIAALTGDMNRFDAEITQAEAQLNEIHAKRWKLQGMRDYAKMIAHVKGVF